MKQKRWFLGAIMALSLSILLSCAPSPTTPQPSQAPAAAASAPNRSAEDNAWSRVVAAGRKEGKVNVYSYNLVGDIGLAVANAFQGKYGIRVDIVTGRGAEFLERVKTERRLGQIVADLHEGSSSHAVNMKTEGLTTSIAGLPVFLEKGVWKVDPFAIDSADRHVASLNFIYYSPWVNTRRVKPGEEPRAWKDLLQPRWKGEMFLTDPFTSGGPEKYFVPLLREKVIDEEFLKALYKQDLSFASSLQEEARLLSMGERSLSIRGTDNSYSRYAAGGAPIKVIDLEDGVVLTPSPVLVAFAGGPHANAAKLFINWLLSKEGLDVYSKAASSSSIRTDVTDYRPEGARLNPKRPIILTEEDNAEAVRLFRERWLPKLWGRK